MRRCAAAPLRRCAAAPLRRELEARVALDRAERGASVETLDHEAYLRDERALGRLLG